ncbi:hypothetical protein PTKIN_Ptkin09bG0277100 [Pterospermum kingtungense]
MEAGGNSKELSLSVDVEETYEPTINVFDGIMDVLEDDSVSLVGVHGIGGIGKSTLLKKIASKAKEDRFFDAVVVVVVSQTPEIMDIHHQIAEQLDWMEWTIGHQLFEERKEMKNFFFSKIMKEKKSILFILDDIRMKLNLGRIGIPYWQHHKGFKILLASRSLNVLREMNTQKIFRVGLLKREAAWDLFKQIAGVGPDLQSIAIEVTKACQGLPIAISMVGAALKDKSSIQWWDALENLKGPSKETTELDQVINSALKLSYDHLRSEELKLTFVLCYVLGHNAATEDLWKYGMALRLFKDTETIAEARDRALALVFELKKSCLLLDSCSDKFFDVHDVARDFAISIASENHLLSVVKDEDVLKYWSDGRKIQYGNVIVLQNPHVDKLPSELNCPQLQIFHMSCKNPSLNIQKGFFHKMPELRALYLSHVTFSSLPSSIGVLANLRSLCLHECFLQDIAIIGQLWKLEILSLSGSDVKKLPYEIGNLTQLRLLDLNNCTELEYIGPGILSRLSRLEELYMINSFDSWGVEGKASLSELNELSYLTSLGIKIDDPRMMPNDLICGRLLRYKIYIGNVRDRSRKYESSKMVKFAFEIRHHPFDVGLKELINKTDGLYLQEPTSLRAIFEGQSFQHLKNLHLYCWRSKEYIFNPLEWNVAFPVLESLSLSYVHGLRICRGTPEVKLFDRLRIVKVENCSALKDLFSLSLFRNLLQLQEIEVEDCFIVEVVADEREEFNENPVICNVLSLRLHSLPQLISFCRQQSTYSSTGDEALFNDKILFPSLEYLQLSVIGVARIWQNQLATTPCFGQNLRTLIVEDCYKLEYLWSESVVGCFVQLKRLEITGCGCMKTIIQTEKKLELFTEAKILFPQLVSLRMNDLANLQGFYFGNTIIEFPTLKQVTVKDCPKLYIFSNGVVSTPKLRNIVMGEYEGIWSKDLNTLIQKYVKAKSCHSRVPERQVGHSPSRKKDDQTKQQGLRMKDKPVRRGQIKANFFRSMVQKVVGVKLTEEPDEREWKPSSSLTAENLEIVPDENEGTLSSHEIETEVAQGQKEEDKVLRLTKKVSQSNEPASILALSEPSTRSHVLFDTEMVESPSLTAENLEIVTDENEGTLSSHEIETEAEYSQKEEDAKALSRVPASTLALSTPSTRSLVPFETEGVVSPPLIPKIQEIVPEENEGTLSGHEIETEAVQSEMEEDTKALLLSEHVSQPALILASSTPSTRAVTELVAEIPSAKDSIPVMEEAKVESPRTEQGPDTYETGVAAITTIEQCVSKILKCMGNDTVRRIAVHGVWGVGKSSVLGALVDNPKTKMEFDLIIRVTVSRNWNPRKIRDQIIQQLPPASSSAEPFQILKDKKCLLLLDDVWERINLQEIGIPDPSPENGNMIILATRELKVCHDMEEIKVVEIEPVSKEEAWKLFHEQVGRFIDSPSIQHFAQGIVERCYGLPLLIVTTGRALAGEKNVCVWQHAFSEFSEPGRDIKSCMEDLIQLLKFCFDRLKSRSLKSCFLYCALFSEEQEINTDEFIEYCIQEGLIAGSWSDAYEMGYDIVDALVHALFLETTDNGRSIRMRDVMKDLALGILSSDTDGCQLLLATHSKPLKPEIESSSTRLSIADGHQFLLEAAAGLTRPPTAEKWEQSKMMFLMDNKLSTLPENPSCPVLETLFLQRNSQLRVVPDHFFYSMPLLKVLNLSKTRIKFLPKSISNLGRLETLILRDCERLVKLPSEVGCLKLLQVLNLRGTEIMDLPDEIAKLESLNHLEVSFYGSSTYSEHAKLPRKLISSLKALNTLSISVYPGDTWWNKNAKSFVKEVSKLKRLTSLNFYLPEVEFLELFLQKSAAWKKESLTEFKFVVGHDVKFSASRVPQYVQLKFSQISGQCLRFVNSGKIPDTIVKVLARCSAFHLDHHLDISRLSEFGIGNMNKLEYCIISECPDLETIADSEEVTEAVFPCLEHLSIHYSWSLTYVCEGVVPEGSFAALRILTLHACPKLTYVFKTSMLQFIYSLEELQVDDCEAIETIVSTDEEVTDTESCCISLKKLTLHSLPALVHIWEGGEIKLLFEYLTVYDCPQLKQICTDSELKQTLKEIRAEQDWWDNLVPEEKGILSDYQDIFTPIHKGDVYGS